MTEIEHQERSGMTRRQANPELLEAVIRKLNPTGPNDKGWYEARCPFHSDDTPSFGFTDRGFSCFGCEEKGGIAKLAGKLGIEIRTGQSIQPEDSGLTLDQLATAKGLPLSHLQSLGWRDIDWYGKRAVAMPTFDATGAEVRDQIRRSLEGNKRFAWGKGEGTAPFGLDRLATAFEQGRLLIVEGGTDYAAVSLTDIPVLGVPGAGAWKKDWGKELNQIETIYVWQEPDDGGTQFVKSIRRTFRNCVVVAAPEGLKDPLELYQHDSENFTEKMQELLAQSELFSDHTDNASPGTPWGRSGFIRTESSGLPEIGVTDRPLRDLVDDSWAALKNSNDPPWLFRNGERLVQVIAHGDITVTPRLRVVTFPTLKHGLDKAANFVKETQFSVKPARPPGDVVSTILDHPGPPVPHIKGIVATPVFTSDGVISTEQGFQEKTGYYLHLDKNLSIPVIPKNPSKADLERSTSFILDELLGDFPFADPPSKHHALSLIIQPFVRLMIDGPTPLYLIESPVAGTGKGLLADVCARVFIGRAPPIMTEAGDKEEWRKRITAKLLESPSHILIDNLSTRLDSSDLAAALTAVTWEDRVLGVSQMTSISVNCTWLATGNNPALSTENARRTIPIRLDSGHERPEARTAFRHRDLKGWADDQRGNLIASCLTICNAWIAEGKPAGAESLGSYENWAQVMGGILGVCGFDGFLGNRERLHRAASSENQDWDEFFQAWWNEFRDAAVTFRTLFAFMRKKGLLLDIWADKSQQGALSAAGKAIASAEDTIHGGFRLLYVGQDGHLRAKSYRLTEVREVRKVAYGSEARQTDLSSGHTPSSGHDSSISNEPRDENVPQPYAPSATPTLFQNDSDGEDAPDFREV